MNQLHPSRRFPHLLIRASAGTGKTYQLSSRFLELLRCSIRAERILAVTFTRKAAGEILERVILRLAESAQDAKKLSDLREATSGGRFGRSECLELLAQLMRNLHRLRVGTLDSFFSQVAHSFSLELGMTPGWQIVDPMLDAQLRRDAIHTVLSAGDQAELRTLIQLLSKGEATRGVSQLVRETVNCLYNLFLATQRDAWHQVPRSKPLEPAALAALVAELRDLELPAARMCTARDADCERVAQQDWSGFLTTGLAKKIHEDDPVYFKQTIPEPAIELYRRLIDHVRAELVGRVALQTEASYRLLAQFHAEYSRLKRDHRVLRFEDVTRQLATLREAVELDRMAFRLDSRIDHLLLDEFQDTSPEQWQVLEPLGQRLTAACADTSFFCVGDSKQAIYGWRGGVAEIFDAIDQRLGNLEPRSLNASYRSSPVIIETVNQVFAQACGHPNLRQASAAVRSWCQRFEVHQTQRQELAGYAQLQTAPQADEDQSQRDVTLGFAADRIAELSRLAPGYTVGVLVRKNDTVGRLIYELRTRQVSASEEGGNPLVDSAGVDVVLSALRLADHPGDSIAGFHVAHSPLAVPLGLPSQHTPHQASQAADSIRRQIVRDGYGPTILAWSGHLASRCNQRELNRLGQLVQMAYSYDSHATLRTTDFVRHVQETPVADPIPADVRVMTVHQAKGLEFDIVVLPELDADLVGQADAFVVDRPDIVGPARRVCRYASQDVQRLMPASWQAMFQQAIDREVSESLCVLYVALTRAVHALHCIIPPSKANERAFPRSFAGLLRTSLKGEGPASPCATLYQHGDPQWYQHPGDRRPEHTAAQIAQAAMDLQPVHVRLPPASGPARRGWQRTSPSALEGGPLVQAEALLSSETKSAAFLRGQLIHAWFEQIEWLEDGLPPGEQLDDVARSVFAAAGCAGSAADRALQDFLKMLKRPPIADVLTRARYADPRGLGFPPEISEELAAMPLVASVQNERGFAYRDGDQLVNGYIDRLVLLRHGAKLVAAEVLDYKTDALEPGGLKLLRQKTQFYAPQLQAYRCAVAQLTGLAPARIAAGLIFLNANRVQMIS